MATISGLNTFTAGTPAQASQVNTNFSLIKSFAEGLSTGANIDAGSITSSKLGTQSVTSEKIATNTIVLEDLATALQAFLVPVGTITAFGSATPPTGWLLCNGQSTTGYTALTAVVGATVPDLRGRTVIGTGTGLYAGATARTIKDIGGSETHTLTGQESGIQQHTHANTLTDPTHAHTQLANYSGTAGGTIGVALDLATDSGEYGYRDVTARTTGVTITNAAFANTNAVNAHNNMQPFFALNYIIKHD
jgi:microcystin-dependent protein